MSFKKRVKTEHAGDKRNHGFWTRREAKTISKKLRRERDKKEATKSE